MNKIKHVHIDGALYFIIAFCGVLIPAFGSDQAKALMSPGVQWSLATLSNAIGAGALALKTYRSTAYADHKRTGETQQFIKPNP